MPYTSPTDTIHAGRLKVPTWIANQAPETWGTVPALNTINDIDPDKNPLINPNHPSPAPWHADGGLEKIMNSWSGGDYDTINHELIIDGGGHSGYAGNEPYKVPLNVEQPAWQMLRNPSGAIGNEGVLNDGQEASGLYFDGRKRGYHSYNKPIFVPNVGLFIAVLGSTAWSGQTGTNRTFLMDTVTGESTALSLLGGTGDSSGGGGCYDPTRHAIWWRHKGTAAISKLDLTTNTWTLEQAAQATSGYYSLAYIPEHDCLLLLSTWYANGFAVFDCVTKTITEPSLIGSTIGSGLSGYIRARHYNGGFIWWNNSSNTTLINKITYGADPRTDAWTVSQLPVAAGNSVTPSVHQVNGTYGRFFLDLKLGICGVINTIYQPIYFYKLGSV